MGKVPTNADLMSAISAIATTLGQVKERGELTHNLAVRTNGRVTKLEEKVIATNAVEEYKQKSNRRLIALCGIFVVIMAPLIGALFSKAVG